jgi:rhodanese-related sulfurtransferase
MADFETNRLHSVTPEQLRREVLDPDEIAVVDVREGDHYASGHISVAVELPFSELELRAALLLPRGSVRIVVTDDDGASLALAAATRLQALGYRNVRVLAGGLQAWKAEGNELITGLNSLSKALGEFVERRYHTPKITAGELRDLIASGEDVVVLDTRPLEEFNHISIPGGIAAPGAELLYRFFDAVPSPGTRVVVNCAGRTRAIIGAQALLNADVPNPVVSLENGTIAWLLTGLEPARGATTQANTPSAQGLAKAREASNRVAARFVVRTIDRELLDTLEAERGDRTLYLFDIRTAEEFEAGHLPGAISVPGGQLVQATDRYVGVREARIVLLDDPDLIRATITASWLFQLGLDDVFVYPASETDRTEFGPAEKRVLGDLYDGELLQPTDLAALIASGAAVLDLEAAPPYFRESLHSRISRCTPVNAARPAGPSAGDGSDRADLVRRCAGAAGCDGACLAHQTASAGSGGRDGRLDCGRTGRARTGTGSTGPGSVRGIALAANVGRTPFGAGGLRALGRRDRRATRP